jgi:ELWxxDGT repeat protein
MRKNVPFQFAGVRISVITCVLMAACLVDSRGQAQLIKDVNAKENPYWVEYSELTPAGSASYFISRNTELWRSTGTSSGTIKIKTFKLIKSLTMVGSTLYFVANDGTSGLELWKSNGTTTGTVRVKDIRVGATGSDPTNLVNGNGILYFAANNGSSGREVWKSDGTSAGTVLVKDILVGSGSSNPTRLTNVNGTVFFNANNNVVGYELWKTNGTSAGTVLVKDIKPGSKLGSHPELLTNANGMLYFVADDGTTGRELWKSNGTASGTVRMKDIYPGITSSYIDHITAVGSSVFFSAYTPTYGTELWKSNGTAAGTVQVVDGMAGSASSTIDNLTNINNILFYTGSLNGKFSIIRTDGTTAGTKAILPALYSDYWISDAYFTLFNGAVYFFNGYQGAPDPASVGLYRTDISGTPATLVKVLYDETDYRNEEVSKFEGQMIATTSTMYLTGRIQESQGYKLVKSDGTTGGTVVVKDTFMPTLGSEPNAMLELNGIVYFVGQGFGTYDYYEGWSRHEVWKTDGTTAGTVALGKFKRVNDIKIAGSYVFYTGLNVAGTAYELWKTNGTTNTLVKSFPESENRDFFGLTASVNGILYFHNSLGEVWRSDGTTAGTTLMRDFHNVRSITYAAGKTFIIAGTEAGGEELWKTIGTPATTTLVKVLRSGYGNSSWVNTPRLTFNNAFYFLMDDGIHGLEVWRSDGTATGTYMAIELRPGDEADYNTDILTMTVYNSSLYLSAKDENGAWAVYKSNGTTSGTVKLKNIDFVSKFISVNNKLLLLREQTQSSTYPELWTTNGTSAGTVHVKVLDEYTHFSGYGDFEVVNNVLYFASRYSDYFWRSDGTTCGTIKFLAGVHGPAPIESIGTDLIFGGYNYMTEREIYKRNVSTTPGNPCGTSIASMEDVEVLEGETEVVSHYPNPFTDQVTIRVDGEQGDIANVRVFASNGAPVEVFENLDCNTDYAIGRQWNSGLYILHVKTKDRMLIRKIVKE